MCSSCVGVGVVGVGVGGGFGGSCEVLFVVFYGLGDELFYLVEALWVL